MSFRRTTITGSAGPPWAMGYCLAIAALATPAGVRAAPASGSQHPECPSLDLEQSLSAERASLPAGYRVAVDWVGDSVRVSLSGDSGERWQRELPVSAEDCAEVSETIDLLIKTWTSSAANDPPSGAALGPAVPPDPGTPVQPLRPNRAPPRLRVASLEPIAPAAGASEVEPAAPAPPVMPPIETEVAPVSSPRSTAPWIRDLQVEALANADSATGNFQPVAGAEVRTWAGLSNQWSLGLQLELDSAAMATTPLGEISARQSSLAAAVRWGAPGSASAPFAALSAGVERIDAWSSDAWDSRRASLYDPCAALYLGWRQHLWSKAFAILDLSLGFDPRSESFSLAGEGVALRVTPLHAEVGLGLGWSFL